MPRVGERYLYKGTAVDIACVANEKFSIEFLGLNKITVTCWLRSSKMLIDTPIEELEGQKLTDEIMTARGYNWDEEKRIIYRTKQLTFTRTPGGFYHVGLDSTFEYLHELQRFENLFINSKIQQNG